MPERRSPIQFFKDVVAAAKLRTQMGSDAKAPLGGDTISGRLVSSSMLDGGASIVVARGKQREWVEIRRASQVKVVKQKP
jgi:hypothetical protein